MTNEDLIEKLTNQICELSNQDEFNDMPLEDNIMTMFNVIRACIGIYKLNNRLLKEAEALIDYNKHRVMRELEMEIEEEDSEEDICDECKEKEELR